MSSPGVSIVIPTAGRRPERLRTAVNSAARQALPGAEVEVIVACDPGTGPEDLPPNARLVEADRPSSPAEKRNLGWRAAGSDLVAFTDDDCRPSPGWLAALVAAAGARPGAFVQGRTEPDPEEVRLAWGLAHTQRLAWDSPWHETCNIAYPRELLERLDGFDSASFSVLGGEDTDLGVRALASGAPKLYVDDAVVWHAVEPRDVRRVLRDARRHPDLPLVFARHPGYRSALFGGLFVHERHGRLALALVGMATRRRGLAALAAVPYIEYHLRSYALTPPSVVRAAGQLPVRVAADLLAILTMARGSARHRTLVL
jgi:glycosyltransferase involved in cell wall biosynthesis